MSLIFGIIALLFGLGDDPMFWFLMDDDDGGPPPPPPN